MLKRCEDPDHTSFKDYGGRGIMVAPEWQDFERYYSDTGEPFSTLHTLDRIDNEKGYGPDNWRWATKAEQSQNRRYCHQLTFDGKTQTASEWARELGLRVESVIWRVKRGWPTAKVLGADPDVYKQGRLITAHGTTKTLRQWSEETGLMRQTIKARLSRGWTPEKAIPL